MAKFRAKTRKGESEADESVSRGQQTAAVEQADLADDGLEAAPGTTTEPGTNEVGVEFASAPGAEQLSELIAQTNSDAEGDSEQDALAPAKDKGDYSEYTDDDGDGGFRTPEERLDASRPTDVFGSGDDSDDAFGASSKTSWGGGSGDSSGAISGAVSGTSSSETSSGDSAAEGSQTGSVGGSGRDLGSVQNPIVNPITGEGQTNPTGSFVDYEGEGGGNAGGGPAPGSGRSVGLEIVTARDGNKTGKVILDDDGKVLSRKIENPDTGITLFEFEGTTVVTDTNNGTITTLKPDGSTTTTTLGGAPVDKTDAVKQPGGVDGEEPVTLEEKFNDSLFRQYQESKNAGGGGDGATDPSETDDVVLKGGGSLTPEGVHDEAVGRFGQPAGDDFGGGVRGGTIEHPDATLIDPTNDQDLVGGGGRTENPDDVMPNTEPVAGMDDTTEEETDDVGGSFLPPGDFTPVDAPPDLPDDVEIGGPTG